MAETSPARVVLLARPGKAADNLAEALRQSGAELVMTADPNAVDGDALLAAKPQAVLVALEPGVEQAVDQLDSILSSPSLTVIFDEAELAAQRAGWDAARWVRHLSAKLHHHADVLPPGKEADVDEWHPSPGQLPKPSSAFANLDMAAFTEEAEGLAHRVPIDGMQADAMPADAKPADTKPSDTIVAGEHAYSASFAQPAEERIDLSGWVDPAAAALLPSANLASAAQTEQRIELQIEPQIEAFSAPRHAQLGVDEIPISESLDSDQRHAPGLVVDETSEQADSAERTIAFDAGLIERIPAPDAAGVTVQAMTLDEDAFFLEELSAAESAPIALQDAQPLEFESIPELEDEFAVESLQLERPQPSLPKQDFDPQAFDVQNFDAQSFDVQSFEAQGFEAAAFDRRAPEDHRFESDVFERQDIEKHGFAERDLAAWNDGGTAFEAPAESSRAEQASAAPVAELAADAEPPGFALDSFGGLSLATDDVQTSAPLPRSGGINRDLSALEQRISGLSLVDFDAPHTNDIPAAQPPPIPAAAPAATQFAPSASVADDDVATDGVVLIEAGLGGPDPVRQVLSGLPAAFPLPVLVRLHLQGGRYDRLVAQMERAASLPIVLAQASDRVRPGRIHFLPEGIGLAAQGEALVFVEHPSPAETVFAALPAARSAVLFLSGSDPQLVDHAMHSASAGALIAAQSPEDCYDGAACAQLRANGAMIGLPAELAGQLASRWPY